jgi:hypothetical protein
MICPKSTYNFKSFKTENLYLMFSKFLYIDKDSLKENIATHLKRHKIKPLWIKEYEDIYFFKIS